MPKVGMEPVRRVEAINAALECMCEAGIDNITLEMVAARAGFSKGILAYYFKTKRQLVLESLKAFLAAYQRKSMSAINAEMTPLQMVQTVVEVSLPPLEGTSSGEAINVSDLNGAEQISLPERKLNELFVQFISKSATDAEMLDVMKKCYQSDIEGIAWLFANARKHLPEIQLSDRDAAYSLLAMIYGLSFFRIAQFLPEGRCDNRQFGLDFIRQLCGPANPQGDPS